MTFPLAIQGLGIVAGFGSSNKDALQAIQNNAGPNASMQVQTQDGPIDYPVYAADPAPLKEFVSPKKLRRINKYSRLATLAACLALQDAGLDIPLPGSNIAVIVASGYGASTTTFKFLDDVILEGDEFASPTQFSNSVHSSAASHITILLQIQGPCLTVTQFEMSPVTALLNAQTWLKEKRVDAVLLGGVDEINPVLLYCYQNLWSGQIPKVMEPLDFQKQTAISGEGAAFMLLTRDEGQAPQYGYINKVSWENASGFELPKNNTIVMGADGHRVCGRRYSKMLQGVDKHNLKTFSTITGSMPSGQMFDVVLASLAARNGLMPDRFCSIKLNGDQDVGAVYVSSHSDLPQDS
ncbi:MAG: beta-ketoacyl synthase N-terminal-like domain-containing protein [Planctomycetota bacterium]